MDGVLVIGLHHGAGEGAVAAAFAAVLRRQGEEVRLVRAIVLRDRGAGAGHAFHEGASPLIASRHQGDALDPEHLVRRLGDGRGVLISSVAGGVFGALTPRFTIRDLASELGLPVILAARATPDATNLVRLSVA